MRPMSDATRNPICLCGGTAVAGSSDIEMASFWYGRWRRGFRDADEAARFGSWIDGAPERRRCFESVATLAALFELPVVTL